MDLIPETVREDVDDATGISQKIVSDWRSSSRKLVAARDYNSR